MRSFFQYFNNNSVLMSYHRIHRLLSIKLFCFEIIRQYITYIFTCMCHALLRLIDAN